MSIAKKVGLRATAAMLGLMAVTAALVANSACIFFILHDGGDEVKVPNHLKV